MRFSVVVGSGLRDMGLFVMILFVGIISFLVAGWVCNGLVVV